MVKPMVAKTSMTSLIFYGASKKHQILNEVAKKLVKNVCQQTNINYIKNSVSLSQNIIQKKIKESRCQILSSNAQQKKYKIVQFSEIS